MFSAYHALTLNDGSVYDVDKLIERTKDRKIEYLPLDRLIFSSSTRTGFCPKTRYPYADTQYPILLSPDNNMVFDGNHRAVKLKRNGATVAAVRRLTHDDLDYAQLYPTRKQTDA